MIALAQSFRLPTDKGSCSPLSDLPGHPGDRLALPATQDLPVRLVAQVQQGQ